MRKTNLLLDTCALIWLVEGKRRSLKPETWDAIDQAEFVYVSAISAWEISLKVARNQLELPLDPSQWFEGAMRKHGLSLASLTVEVLIKANSLPWHHRDPADRFIISTAIEEKATVVTSDVKFKDYPVEIIG